jgi:heterodisulfide reductase subunit B
MIGKKASSGVRDEMKYALFLGCMIPQRIPSVEIAAKKVFEKLDIAAIELQGYSCCPDSVVARLLDRKMWLTLAARNLSLAEEQGLDLLVLCNGCYETLVEAKEILKRDPQTAKEIGEILAKTGKKYEGKVKVRHVIEVLYEDVGVDKIKKFVKKPLKLRLAIHPGCHMFRETEGGDIWRKPKQFEEIVKATGADVVKNKLDRLCCGFPVMQVNEEFALKRNLLPKLAAYQEHGIEGVVVSCPACNVQFETGQVLLRKYGARYNIPCLHIVELLAMAFGYSAKELALDIHRSPVQQLAQKVI